MTAVAVEMTLFGTAIPASQVGHSLLMAQGLAELAYIEYSGLLALPILLVERGCQHVPNDWLGIFVSAPMCSRQQIGLHSLYSHPQNAGDGVILPGSMLPQAECCVHQTPFGMGPVIASPRTGQLVSIPRSWPMVHAVRRMASMTGRATRAGKGSATAVRAPCQTGHPVYCCRVSILSQRLHGMYSMPPVPSSDADLHTLLKPYFCIFLWFRLLILGMRCSSRGWMTCITPCMSCKVPIMSM
jgi:hypothetical protein